MYESCAGLETELHASLRTADIHLFDVVGLGEVLYVSRAVKDGVDIYHLVIYHLVIYVACHIAIDNEEAGTEELIKTSVEIVEEQVTQTSLRIVLVFSANKTSDGLGVRINQFAQDMDAEITGSTGEQYIA